MNIEVGERYLYKRYVGVDLRDDVVEVLRLNGSNADVKIIGGGNAVAGIDFLHEFEAHFPNVEPQDEPSKPAHYDTGIDTIAFMRANCPPEQVEGFLRGNAIKYLQRYDKKNGVEDLKKARHYIEMLIEEVEGSD